MVRVSSGILSARSVISSSKPDKSVSHVSRSQSWWKLGGAKEILMMMMMLLNVHEKLNEVAFFLRFCFKKISSVFYWVAGRYCSRGHNSVAAEWLLNKTVRSQTLSRSSVKTNKWSFPVTRDRPQVWNYPAVFPDTSTSEGSHPFGFSIKNVGLSQPR